MMQIKDGRSVYTDSMDKIHKTEKGVVCCDKKLRCIAHMDGAKFCVSTYECECGNHISVETKRSKEDAMWWS